MAEETMDREAAVRLIVENQLKDYDRNDHAERMKIGRRKAANGDLDFVLFNDPSIIFTLDELKVLVPLDRDRLNYGFSKPFDKLTAELESCTDSVRRRVLEKQIGRCSVEKGTCGKLAKNHYGLLSIPKQKGRRNHHMSQHHQALKSESLRVFRSLLETHVAKFKATTADTSVEYSGIPDDVISVIGKQAARIAIRNVNERMFRKRRKARRRQEHSRKVNAGLPVTSQKRYINRGGPYGNS